MTRFSVGDKVTIWRDSDAGQAGNRFTDAEYREWIGKSFIIIEIELGRAYLKGLYGFKADNSGWLFCDLKPHKSIHLLKKYYKKLGRK